MVRGAAAESARYIASHSPAGCGVICFSEYASLFPDRLVKTLGNYSDQGEQARRIFDALRYYDGTDVTEIWAQEPDTGGIGLAVANRLNKAAGFHIIDV